MRKITSKIKEYVERADLERPHLGCDAAKLDSMTALEFASTEFDDGELAQMLFSMVTGALLGIEPDEISALQFIDYVKSGTGLRNILADGKDGGQYLWNRQGNQGFTPSMAAELHPGSVKTSTSVKSISQSDKGCVVETTDGTRYHAEKVIISVPTPLYRQIRFDPELPLAKKTLGESTKLGYYSKTILVFSSPWWRMSGLSGSLSSSKGPISFTRDTCVPEDEQYSITCFHVGGAGRVWSELPARERRDAVVKQFHEMCGVVVTEVPKPIKVLEKEWTKDLWARGALSPVMMPGTMMSEAGKALRDPVGHVHFVGTETSVMWKGTWRERFGLASGGLKRSLTRSPRRIGSSP